MVGKESTIKRANLMAPKPLAVAHIELSHYFHMLKLRIGVRSAAIRPTAFLEATRFPTRFEV
jgi:hypothetical protein